MTLGVRVDQSAMAKLVRYSATGLSVARSDMTWLPVLKAAPDFGWRVFVYLSVGWAILLLSGLPALGGTDVATAIRFYTAERYGEGKDLLEQFLVTHQHSATAHYYLGKIYLELQDYDKAIEHCQAATAIQANKAEYHFCLGVSYGKKAQQVSFLSKALLAPKIKQAFERTVLLDQHHIQGRAGLANFYLQAPAMMGGNLDKAYEQATILLKLDAEKGRQLLDKILRRKAREAAAEAASRAQEEQLSD